MFKPTRLDDKVVVLRALIGLLFGLIAYFLIYRFNITIFSLDVSSTIWVLAGIVYVATAFYVQYWVRTRSLFLIFIRGILTFYSIWIIVFIALYDLLG
jgi:hypothetical protein